MKPDSIMRWTTACLLVATLFSSGVCAGEQGRAPNDRTTKAKSQVAVPDATPDVHIPLAREFEGVDIVNLFIALAKEAKVELVITEDLTGTVTIRLEDKTPLETIGIICQQKGLLLLLDKKTNVLTVRRAQRYVGGMPGRPPAQAGSPEMEKSLETFGAQLMVPVLTGFYDAILDYGARVETGQKLAKGKKVLFDALKAEGFTEAQALQIVVTSPDLKIMEGTK